jgi:hypothetical protein
MNALRDPLPSVAGTEWPALPLEAWKDTYATLHMWTQIAGHVRMALSPKVNHFWSVTFYVTPRGLSTSAIPYKNGIFEIVFDFIEHQLVILTSSGGTERIALRPQTVADFYEELMSKLRSLGIEAHFHGAPDEVPDPIPFAKDRTHASYDPEYANRFWRILVLVDRVFQEFRARFIGKCSPVHFFWGSFDLAVTRFSGRRAPEKSGADLITREAYSHEVSSAGFWPGSGDVKEAAFYSYTVPEPAGFADAKVKPAAAFYDPKLREFLLMYDEVRSAGRPNAVLMEFLQTTYEAGANLGHWDREALEQRTP